MTISKALKCQTKTSSVFKGKDNYGMYGADNGDDSMYCSAMVECIGRKKAINLVSYVMLLSASKTDLDLSKLN